MQFVSLGRHCDVIYNIKKCVNADTPTHFFDSLRVDFKSVLYILNLRCIDPIMNIDNFNLDKELYAHENELSITLKNFDRDNITLLFHHDILLTGYDESGLPAKLEEFVSKYKRRFERLIDLISSEKELYFIHKVHGESIDFRTDIDDFDKIIKSINGRVKYCLITLVQEEGDYIFTKHNNHLNINITTFIDENKTPDWKRSEIDWESIFRIIKCNAFSRQSEEVADVAEVADVVEVKEKKWSPWARRANFKK